MCKGNIICMGSMDEQGLLLLISKTIGANSIDEALTCKICY